MCSKKKKKEKVKKRKESSEPSKGKLGGEVNLCGLEVMMNWMDGQEDDDENKN